MIYRDLSLSLAAHAALIAALLTLSATRQPVRIPEVVRPVRLMTSLELPAAAPARSARPTVAAPPPAPTSKPAERPLRPRAAEPAPSAKSSAPAKSVAPIAIPKFVMPTGAPAATVPPKSGPRPAESEAALRDRLARRLSTPPEEKRFPVEAAAPRLASLPPPEVPSAPRQPTPGTATAAAPAGPVQSIGFFPHAWYLAVLKERVFSRWSPPSEFYVGAGGVAALVSFRIDRAGRISRVAVRESSGHARFDRSALAAIQGLAQVPALPEQYQEDTLDVVIRFQNE